MNAQVQRTATEIAQALRENARLRFREEISKAAYWAQSDLLWQQAADQDVGKQVLAILRATP